MSLTVDGVWKVGVWATTVWADGVWREGDAPPAVVEQERSYALGGGGGAFMLTGAGHKRRKKDETARRDLEAAFALFERAEPEVQAEVREIALPVTTRAESGAVMIPMDGLLARLDLTQRLLDLYARLRAAQIEDEEDDDFLMVGH